MKHAYRKFGNIETKISSFWRNFHKWLCRKLLRPFHNHRIRAFHLSRRCFAKQCSGTQRKNDVSAKYMQRGIWTWQIPSIRILIVKKIVLRPFYLFNGGPKRWKGGILLIETGSLCGGPNNCRFVDVIKWKHFLRYWPFVRGIHRWPVNSPHKRPVTRSFNIFFHLRPNKRLSRQSWGWWFETPSCPLWRRCNGFEVLQMYKWFARYYKKSHMYIHINS